MANSNKNQLQTLANPLKEANKALLDFLIEKYKDDTEKKNLMGTKQNALGGFETVISKTTNSIPKILALLNAYVVMTEELFSDLPRSDDPQEAELRNNVDIARNSRLEQIRQLQPSPRISIPTDVAEEKSPNLADESYTNQFLNYLGEKSPEYCYTEKLLKGQNVSLTDIEIRNLIDSWGCAIVNFFGDARTDTDENDPHKFGLSATLAGFLYIHDQLETLYTRLTTNVLREESLL